MSQRYDNELIKLASQTDYILLDGSSSMNHQWTNVCRAVDSYVEGVKREGINSQVYLHVFSSGEKTDLCAFNDHISKYEAVAARTAIPNWGTALYDAVGLMALRLRELDPERASIVIVTDGADVGSSVYDVHQARSFLDWMRAKGWTVTFIGADFSNSEQARMLGADDSNTCAVSKARLFDAASAMVKKRTAYGRGNADDINFTEDEQQKFGGYLSAPK